jgi:hypothetical protein
VGAVAVDAGGTTWWLDAGGHLHRHGDPAPVRAGVAAIAPSASGLAVLAIDGELCCGDRSPIALEPAHDLAVDDIAGVAYLALDGVIVARGLDGNGHREIAAIDAAALVLSSDRRRLYVADRSRHRVLAVTIEIGAPRIDVVVEMAAAEAVAGELGDGPTGLGMAPAGLVATWSRAVLGINVRHGVRAVLHGPGATPVLTTARGVAAGRDKRRLWVVDDHRLIAVATDGTGAVVITPSR